MLNFKYLKNLFDQIQEQDQADRALQNDSIQDINRVIERHNCLHDIMWYEITSLAEFKYRHVL